MHYQSKNVGKKPGTSKRKGVSKSKPDIENYIDASPLNNPCGILTSSDYSQAPFVDQSMYPNLQ